MSTEATPKKSIFTLKKLFILISFILGVLGIDHYTVNLVSGGSITVNDSTIVVAATPTVSVDTVKVDTLK